MKATIDAVPPPPEGEPAQPLWRRLAWFAALWVAGFAAISLVAWVLRLIA